LSTLEKEGGARSGSPHDLSVNKACRSSQQTSPSTREGERGSSPQELLVNKACKSRQLESLSTREGRKSKELLSVQTFSKQRLQN
jgi:hypothetical protein